MSTHQLREKESIGDVKMAETIRENVQKHAQLSEEEMEIAKKLRTKIDIRIMPMVILVYLMNYIDRYFQAESV